MQLVAVILFSREKGTKTVKCLCGFFDFRMCSDWIFSEVSDLHTLLIFQQVWFISGNWNLYKEKIWILYLKGMQIGGLLSVSVSIFFSRKYPLSILSFHLMVFSGKRKKKNELISLSNSVTKRLLLHMNRYCCLNVPRVRMQLQWKLKCSLCNGPSPIVHYPVTDRPSRAAVR